MRIQSGKKTRGYRSLPVTLTLAFLVVSLSILIVSSGLEIFFNFKRQQLNIGMQQHLAALNAAGSVGSYIQERIGLLNATVRLGKLLNVPLNDRKVIIDKLLGIEPSFRRIVLLDAEGEDLSCVSRRSQFGLQSTANATKKEILHAVKEGTTFISPVYIDSASSEPLVMVAVAVTDAFGDYKGALLAEVNLKFMWDVVDRMEIGRTGLAYVVDRRGNLIAARDISRVLRGENLLRLKDVAEFSRRTEGSPGRRIGISRGFAETYVVSDYVALGMPDWAVVVELPVKEAFEPVISTILITMGIVIGCFLIAAFVGIYLSRRISQPIIMLRNATAKIGEGRFDTRISVKSTDEIGELAQSINRMSNDLQRTTTSLDNLNREIEERKKTERALAESEKNFRRMFEITSEGVALINPETGRFIAANPAMCSLFGYSEEQFRRLTLEDITPEEAKKTVRQSMQTLADRRDVPDHEETAVCKDGSRVNVIAGMHHMSWNGEPVCHITLTNITFLKDIQEQLRKKNREILEFTNMVTHDLRKPLTAMKIILELAGKGSFGALDSDGAEAISTGLEASRYMQEMLEDLMSCARLESGTQELIMEEVRFRELIAAVIARLKYLIGEKEIIFDLPKEDPLIRADKKQLTGALMNLVGNAINYIGTGPDRRIRIGWKQGEGPPVLFIEDNGIGIPEASQKHLFEKFTRGGNVHDTVGSGLGLFIVKCIVEAHNGKIWFESEEGKGTTFYFTLSGD
ncbi:MAG: PAS domain S-box protein [Chitinispirillaceae bacterium]|nr:PAS domain S-box protein [Chitinispirillaceae bacterium]